MNFNTVYNAMQKQAAGVSGDWNPRRYGKQFIDNTPKYESPDGYSNKGRIAQIGDNLKNWFGQKTWDMKHGIDTALGTNLNNGAKRPGKGNQRDWGFFDYAFAPVALGRDLVSGLGDVFKTKPQMETQARTLNDWQKRKQSEINGTNPEVADIGKYNTTIELPNQTAFKNMALQEANDPRYSTLRHQGMNQEQIANYIMKEKYLPMIRNVTGRQNIIPTMQLTDKQNAAIKEQMLDTQMAALQRSLNTVDPKTGTSLNANWTPELQKQYRQQLSDTYDANMKAVQNYDPSQNQAVQDKIKAVSGSFNLNNTQPAAKPKQNPAAFRYV